MKANIVIITLVVFAISFLVFLIIDEPLLSEVETILNNKESEKVADTDNAYLALLGATIESDEELHVRGRKEVRRRSKQSKKLDISDNLFQIEFETKIIKLTFANEDGLNCYAPDNLACVDSCCWNDEQLNMVRSKNSNLIQIYEQILNYKKYQAFGVSIPLNTIDALVNVSIFNIIYLIENKKPEKAYRHLIESIIFWRTVLDNSNSQLERLSSHLALNKLLKLFPMFISHKNNYVFEANILQALYPHDVYKAINQMRISELKQANIFLKNSDVLKLSKDRLMENGIASELVNAIFFKITFKPNVTLNNIYKEYEPLLQDGYKSCVKPDESKINNSIYNYVGRVLTMNTIRKSHINYEIKFNANLQILRVLFEMKANDFELESVEDIYVNNELSKEYTGQKVSWDKKDNVLFMSLSEGYECYIIVQHYN